MTIRLYYDRWPQYERRLVESIRDLTPEQLALRAAPEHRPVWAIASHVAATRVYWLCHVLGEPGAETRPSPTRAAPAGRTTSITRANDGVTLWRKRQLTSGR